MAQTRDAWKIVCGDTLALTPPMGWNSWYIHYDRVTDQHHARRGRPDDRHRHGRLRLPVRQYRRLLDECSKPAASIRDPQRGGHAATPKAAFCPNRRFPDMKALTDYIHAKGLKAGIYTSPGPSTCGGYTGSYRHEAQDARQFAAVGFRLPQVRLVLLRQHGRRQRASTSCKSRTG